MFRSQRLHGCAGSNPVLGTKARVSVSLSTHAFTLAFSSHSNPHSLCFIGCEGGKYFHMLQRRTGSHDDFWKLLSENLLSELNPIQRSFHSKLFSSHRRKIRRNLKTNLVFGFSNPFVHVVSLQLKFLYQIWIGKIKCVDQLYNLKWLNLFLDNFFTDTNFQIL